MPAQGRDGLGDTAYKRHQPEQTLLYQFIEAHYPALVDQLAQQGKFLPDHFRREFDVHTGVMTFIILKLATMMVVLRVGGDDTHWLHLHYFSRKAGVAAAVQRQASHRRVR